MTPTPGLIEYTIDLIVRSAGFWLSLEWDYIRSLFVKSWMLATLAGLVFLTIIIAQLWNASSRGVLDLHEAIEEILQSRRMMLVTAVLAAPPTAYLIAGIIAALGHAAYEVGAYIAENLGGHYTAAAFLALAASSAATVLSSIALRENQYAIAGVLALLDSGVAVPTLAAALYLSQDPGETLVNAVGFLSMLSMAIMFLCISGIFECDPRDLLVFLVFSPLAVTVLLPLAAVPPLYSLARIVIFASPHTILTTLLNAVGSTVRRIVGLLRNPPARGWHVHHHHTLPPLAPQPVQPLQPEPQAAVEFDVDAFSCGFTGRVRAQTLGELYQAIGVDPVTVASVRIVTQGGLVESPDPMHLAYQVPGDAVFVEVICR